MLLDRVRTKIIAIIFGSDVLIKRTGPVEIVLNVKYLFLVQYIIKNKSKSEPHHTNSVHFRYNVYLKHICSEFNTKFIIDPKL